MKIQKILFSTSPEYSPFWNLQSQIWHRMGVKPVCLLFGKKSDTDMSEEFGKVIEREFIPGLVEIVQLTWSKFDFPATEPETTWMIGDIDLVPLQRQYFTDNIAGVPDAAYIHLNAGGISTPQLGRPDGFYNFGSQQLSKERRGPTGADLPGHYHVAKGSLFEELFVQGRPFENQVRHIVDCRRHGLGAHGPQTRSDGLDASNYYWCSEESYSSELLQLGRENGIVTFVPGYYDNGNDRQRVDRSAWTGHDYTYTPERVSSGQMVDVHCARPYAVQAEALKRLVDLSGVMR